ncbi:MAG: ABC transporter permease [Planctomycetota bacterium]|nr:MAG: ABC transporter permease [Planctomycetota bacterium]
MSPLRILLEALGSLRREARRLAPMAAGIAWGVASVFLLAAICEGFERTQRQTLAAFGDSFLLLRMNRSTGARSDPSSMRDLRIEREDVDQVRARARSIAHISPKGQVWGARVLRGGEASRISLTGVDPEYNRICNVPLEPGSRWLDRNDADQELPVVVLGYGVRDELFGTEPCVGRKIQVSFRGGSAEDAVLRELTVIGAVRDVELSDERYVSNRGVGFIPYPVFERLSQHGASYFVVRPVAGAGRDEVLGELRAILGERYGFSAGDPSAITPYFDALDRGRRMDAVFGGLDLFLSAVGALILLLGAVGVANVVLMSVAARGFEFGLRRALGCRRRWIFAQVFLEAGLVCTLSGVLGFGLGLLGVRWLARVPLPEGFAVPQADLGAALIPSVLLFVVSLAAAAWPAARAVRVHPIRALHGSGL